MKPVLEVPLTEDLTPFTALLWEHEVPHRVVETEDQQVLFISERIDPEQIKALYRFWREGGDLNAVEIRTEPKRRFSQPLVAPARIRMTLALIVLSVVLTLVIGFGGSEKWMAYLTFTDFSIIGDRIRFDGVGAMLASGQWWRLITPIFLHFSILHILFNLLWVWVVGQRVELLQGSWALLGVVLFSGIASNIAQYWVSGPMFGGMSGVVFGLLGYTWLWDRFEARYRFNFPPALMGLMVLWLGLGFTGVLEAAGLGAIANTAHLVGLLAGLAWWPIGRLFGPRSA
ncbi:GlpG protein (membrane protein of glp regulon) [Marinobacterium lacunae]|uniref:GlpG protein (Membrane protein of glp regulon) n=1 Tax=Marinobacterium lacunae TaxID=1232683 RepID=A0A081FV38_9GAMM|nr:rhomboid family intramembrane serine protease [Marinobacterium lacunae]KEA62393.1 GlpG protein (membrane protein of glp regulon) [Marinobacterium lacunae]MBR9885146.1 rhomboid family intramembrane serine protease [Oceanospirillales bacterium]